MSKFEPEGGGNQPFLPDYRSDDPLGYSYANINKLRKELEKLKSAIAALKPVLTSDISGYALPVDESDKKFVESHQAEWPSSLGDPRSQVSYHYYRELKRRPSTSAGYISKRYEEAARDVTGTSSLDLMMLLELIEKEAQLVEEFIDGYVDKVDDSSEKRLLELFQDWVQSGIRYTGEIRTHFAENAKIKLPSAEVERATSEESRQGQAVFKVRLNKANEDLDNNIQFLYKNFSEHAPVFYKQYLGPALDFRLNISRAILPASSTLAEQINAASAETDASLRGAIVDQMRRRDLFSKKMNQIITNLKDRDGYRNFIVQLSERGKTLPATGPSIMVQADEDPSEIEYWYEHEEDPPEDSSGSLVASHRSLRDRDDADAHAQYLLRSGGTLTGHVHMTPGTRIDHIIPSTHRHTGADGSAQIHGDDIIGGTLPPDAVDPNQRPPDPLNLRLIDIRERMIPPGYTTFDAIVAWDGNSKYTYEVQIGRI